MASIQARLGRIHLRYDFLLIILYPLSSVVEFELGLELDSAEVRGVLIHQGQDWGRVVFDFRA